MLARLRDPPVFSGVTDLDVDDWLVQFHRAASHNNWDDAQCMSNVVFYISGTALRWFENNESLMTSWTSFKESITKTFQKADDRKQQASRCLAIRQQIPGEPFQCYLEDVLSLCRKVDPQMPESTKVGHLLKGISDGLFHAVAAHEHASVDSLAAACRRVEELRRSRIQFPSTQAQIGQSSTEEHALASLVRRIVREELAMLKGSQPTVADRPTVTSPAWPLVEPSLRQLVQDELTRTADREIGPRTYAAVCAAPAPGLVSPPAALDETVHSVAPMVYQRPTRFQVPPICYYCGFVGHIARFCRRRQADRQRQRPWTPYGNGNGRYQPPYQEDRQQQWADNNVAQGYPRWSGRPDSSGRNSRSPSPAGRRRSVSPMRPAAARTVPVN